MTVQGPTAYTDFAGLAALRSKTHADDPEVLRQVARQFETLFTSMMLKSMRSASLGDPLFGGNDHDTYRDMFDQQVAVEMSTGKGFGIAEMLVRQLSGTLASGGAEPGGLVNSPLPRTQAASTASPGSVDSAHAGFAPDDAAGFVRGIWPHAQSAGRALGVDPRAIIAQAALETGWGQHMIKDDDGVVSNNLFGIKAGRDWAGDRVSVSTLEFEDGLPRRQQAAFRSYGTLAEGFQDYVGFLKSNGRYRQALEVGSEPGAFADGLQRAGFATDPRYAEKIRDIVDGERLESVLGPLKFSDVPPTKSRGTGDVPDKRMAATRVGA